MCHRILGLVKRIHWCLDNGIEEKPHHECLDSVMISMELGAGKIKVLFTSNLHNFLELRDIKWNFTKLILLCLCYVLSCLILCHVRKYCYRMTKHLFSYKLVFMYHSPIMVLYNDPKGRGLYVYLFQILKFWNFEHHPFLFPFLILFPCLQIVEIP